MLNKQALDLRFGTGIDTKTDKYQVQVGKLLSLQNAVFEKGGLLQKRNGFEALKPLPDASNTYLSTYNGGLLAIGDTLNSYSAASNKWIDKGAIKPVTLDTLPVIRSGANQSQCDSAVSDSGLVCTVFTDILAGSTSYKYTIQDLSTGQVVVNPTVIPVATGVVTGSPRVFILNSYFIIVFTNVITAVSHLQFVSIPISNPSSISAEVDIASSYISATTVAWDGVVANSRLFIAYNTTAGGQSVKVTYINSSLTVVTPRTFATAAATLMSLSADMTSPQNPQIYISYYNLATTTAKTAVVDQNLNVVLAPHTLFSSGTVLNMASTAKSAVGTIVYEVPAVYGYDSGISTNIIKKITCTQSGTVGAVSTIMRSVGLASKAALVDDTMYFLTIYSSGYQPTYFLANDSGQVVSKLAYSNADDYLTLGLPSITVIDSTAYIPYLVKDLLEAVNKTQGAAVSTGFYTQTGINLAEFTLGSSSLSTSEIGGNLNLSGGIIWSYDGVAPVEQGFLLWPDYVETTPSTSGGSMADQQYFYQVTYEWTDNKANIIRSAPSIPVVATVSGGSGSGSVTIDIPTLRLTYKTSTPVRIVVYRWSAAQQTYYQLPDAIIPYNNTAVDSVAVVDTYADSSILGNSILYTTGGVIENIAPPASSLLTLFNNRLFLVDAEDRNLLWFSKQVIEATPVEMSDLLTLYVAPTTASEGSTGPITAIAPMDDKLIVFKNNALGYINGIGPDNTGANGQYSDFALINSTVGCANQQSIVFTPRGLMFQSNKGIWLLGRDLSTEYIGAPVEDYNSYRVLSAINVPATNQVRFTLSSGITLVYDYYFGQWGTFVNVPAISSTIFEDLHTFINSSGKVYREKPGSYLDGSNPVLLSFTTGWINLAGLQGYERFYDMLLLGSYFSPFSLSVSFAYNYNPSVTQLVTVHPSSLPKAWGGEQLWGSSGPWGGMKGGNVFKARVFPKKQTCESFQITVSEAYDPSAGVSAGQGLTLSGMTLEVGVKRGTRPTPASRSFG